MDKITIPIDAQVMYQMYQYAHYARHHYKAEIAGWGFYDKDAGIYGLAPLIKQIVKGAEVETFPSPADLGKLNKKDYKNMIVQWHSHVDMGCTPSSVDIEMIEDALELYPMIISIIVNCKGEYTATYSVKHAGVFEFEEFQKFDVELVPYYYDKTVSKEVKAKLSLPKPPKPALELVEGRDITEYQGFRGYWEAGAFHAIGRQKENYKRFPETDWMYGFMPQNGNGKVKSKFNIIKGKANELASAHKDELRIINYADSCYVTQLYKANFVIITKLKDRPPDYDVRITLNNYDYTWDEIVEKLGYKTTEIIHNT